MVFIEENLNINFKSGDEFSKQLKKITEQLPAILDDFEKYYVFYNMNSTNNEYQSLFENIKNNLISLNSQTFILSNGIEEEINKVNKIMILLDGEIKKEKETNRSLNFNLQSIKEKENSSNLMITNYKQLYDIGYLRNWGLVLSIITAGFLISKISKKNVPTNLPTNLNILKK
jgi:hypothetical protein